VRIDPRALPFASQACDHSAKVPNPENTSVEFENDFLLELP
jgi:hypothetical protein